MITILSKHDNLSEFGDTFELIPYEGKEGYFKLKGNIEKEDDIIDIPEEISDPEEFDDELEGVENSSDGTEINFDLEL